MHSPFTTTLRFLNNIPRDKGRQLLAPYFITILYIFWISCDDRELSLKKICTLPKPAFNEQFVESRYFSEGEQEFLCNWDKRGNILEIAELYSGEIIKTISLSPASDKKILYEKYYLPLSVDSFLFFNNFMLPGQGNIILLISEDGDIMSEWDIDSIFPGKRPYSIMPVGFSPALFRDNKIYLQKVLNYNHKDEESRIKSNSEPLELVIDLKGNTPVAHNVMGAYPREYMEDNYLDYYAYRALSGHNPPKLIYSFGACDDLLIFEEDGVMHRTSARSKYINKFNPYKVSLSTDPSRVKEYYRTEPRYGSLYYDKYRKLYYRLVKHRVAKAKPDGFLTEYWDQGKSIIVLDEDFKKLGEVLLDKSTFLGIVDVCKKGIILLSKGDNKVNFDVYQIVQD